MANNLQNIVSKLEHQTFATRSGTHMHSRLMHVIINDVSKGDSELVNIVSQDKMLSYLFSSQSRTEVPIAGYVKNRFVSRRIDRLLIDDTTKTVFILDYKTDTDKQVFREKYISQLAEYSALLSQIYPGYDIKKYLLWTNDWTLEQIL